ncbi:MAG: extracellular solute-binding protein [Christensenellales bacterium]
MKKLRKISVFSIVVLLVFATFLTSCGNSNDDREYDDDETIVFSWLLPSQQSLSLNQTKIIQKIKNDFNVDFEFTTAPTGQLYDQKKQLALSGADSYDITSWVSRDEANYYGGDGVFKDLSGYFESGLLPNLKRIADSSPADKKNLYSPDGEIFRLPDVNKDPSTSNLEFSILKAELVAAGKTVDDLKTWEGFYETLKAIKNLRGANAENYYPLNFRGNTLGIEVVLYPFIFGFTNGQTGYYSVTKPGFDVDGDAFVNQFNTDGFRDALLFVRKLINEKLLDPSFTDNSNQGTIVENLKNGKTACIYDYNGGFSGSLSAQEDIAAANENKENSEDYVLIPFSLPLSQGSNYLGIRSNVIGVNGTVLSADMSESKTKRILKVLDWLYSDEAYEYLYWHKDVTTETDGVKQYKNDNMYKGVATSVDVYLPWSFTSLFQVDYYTVLKPDNEYAKFRTENILDEANDGKYFVYPALSFTFDQLETLNSKQAAVSYYFQTNISRIIKGDASIADFVAELNNKGMNDIVAIYNQAYKAKLN